MEAKNTHGERQKGRRTCLKGRVRRRRKCQREGKGKDGQEEGERAKSVAGKEKESELKRLLSGSETLFLAAYRLSLSAWLLGGGTAGSHWCHSPVNWPDRRTTGPHVVVRKLSVSHAAAAYDIIQDRLWKHACTVCVTKNILRMHVALGRFGRCVRTYHQNLLRHIHTHSSTRTQFDSLRIAPHGLASPLAVLPSTLLPKSPRYWQDNNPLDICTPEYK